MKPAGPLRSGCGVETFETSKHRPTPGCHHGSYPTHLGLDVRREPGGIRHEQAAHQQGWSRECPFYFVVRDAHSFASYLVSLKVSATSMRAAWFTETSRECVIALDLILPLR